MEQNKVTVRLARDEDARDLLKVHYDAIHNTASADYPADIVSEWAKPVDEDRIRSFLQNPDNEIRLAAELGGRIMGFGALVAEKNELRACYVASAATGKGVGRALVSEIERIAQDKGLTYLKLDSSVTAEKFYQACGYQCIERGKHTMRNGMVMDCITMKKDFS